MWNTPSKERLDKIPKLYDTEHISLRDKLVYLHFFVNGSDWFVVEHIDGIFFGFVILNNDYQMAEWGYFGLSELKSIKVNGWLEIDCELEKNWRIRKACEVNKICVANGWSKERKAV